MDQDNLLRGLKFYFGDDFLSQLSDEPDQTSASGPAAPARSVSARKRAANRANAQKSTGPRTPAGKAVSRFNGLRHGLRAGAIGLLASASDQEREAFESLLARLVEDLQPAGVQEELLVERLAMAYLRQLRAYRAEGDTMARRSKVDNFDQKGLTWLPDELDFILRYDAQAERTILRVYRELRRLHRERRPAQPRPVAPDPPPDPIADLATPALAPDHPALPADDQPPATQDSALSAQP